MNPFLYRAAFVVICIEKMISHEVEESVVYARECLEVGSSNELSIRCAVCD